MIHCARWITGRGGIGTSVCSMLLCLLFAASDDALQSPPLTALDAIVFIDGVDEDDGGQTDTKYLSLFSRALKADTARVVWATAEYETPLPSRVGIVTAAGTRGPPLSIATNRDARPNVPAE